MRCAPLFQLVMMPSSVLLIIASSADSISAASQYGANSGLARFLKWLVETLGVFSSERVLPMTAESSGCTGEYEGARRGVEDYTIEKNLRPQWAQNTQKQLTSQTQSGAAGRGQVNRRDRSQFVTTLLSCPTGSSRCRSGPARSGRAWVWAVVSGNRRRPALSCRAG